MRMVFWKACVILNLLIKDLVNSRIYNFVDCDTNVNYGNQYLRVAKKTTKSV